MVGMEISSTNMPHSAAVLDAAGIAELRAIAVQVARDAAELVAQRRKEWLAGSAGPGDGVETKTSAVDPVTVVDRESEKFILAALQAARPADGFLGEEGSDTPGTSGVTWVVDPIDGTVNFLYGVPEYAVSVAAVYGGEPVAGAVASVARQVIYHAGQGQGAVVEDAAGAARSLHASSQPDLALSLVATGFGYVESQRAWQGRILSEVLPRVRDIRRMGSAALDLCRVAEGSVDAYYEHGTKAWDYAAGVIIAREAGARVSHPGMDYRGGGNGLCLAAPAASFPALEALVRRAEEGSDL